MSGEPNVGNHRSLKCLTKWRVWLSCFVGTGLPGQNKVQNWALKRLISPQPLHIVIITLRVTLDN
eukprot:scaffold82539_cov16-Prasinocladus_malaysianus.AAC.1